MLQSLLTLKSQTPLTALLDDSSNSRDDEGEEEGEEEEEEEEEEEKEMEYQAPNYP